MPEEVINNETLNKILQQLEELKAENVRLNEKQINQERQAASGVRHTSDTSVNLNGVTAARSVTIRTRPVQDSPEDYINVVDPVIAITRRENHDKE